MSSEPSKVRINANLLIKIKLPHYHTSPIYTGTSQPHVVTADMEIPANVKVMLADISVGKCGHFSGK